ncbi:activating transcription factor 3-like [Tachypleus tridentatus]|uniref:activating transcription factor 3-like n=1 Tax=Tachypleus tridentatus TaxID=6853 RepID=UPI003FCF6C8A
MFGYDPTSSSVDLNNLYQSCMEENFMGSHFDVPPNHDLLEMAPLPEIQYPTTHTSVYEQSYHTLTPSSPHDFVSQSSPSLDSPHSSTSSPRQHTPTSVQATRSQLIKEGLRVTIQTKRMAQGKGQVQPEYRDPPQESITPEDEERRRRRRERNKVAATKCRYKKKERTQWLAIESDHLETDNSALRREIQELEEQKRHLMELLHGHHCSVPQRSYVQLQVGYPQHHQ